MTTLLIATRNAHKTGEISAILGAQFQFRTLNDFPSAPKVVEDADTFAGNAAKKAVELARWICSKHSTFNIQHSTPNLVLADDSGLEVDALNGAPGVHSARFAALDRSAGGPPASSAGNTPDADNNAKLLRLLQNIPPEKRTARFHCVIALAEIGGGASVPVRRLVSSPAPPILFDGVCEGRILFAPRGQNGFGYDPLFMPVGFEQTFAELGEDVKNKLSHRAKALGKLKDYFCTAK
ncbi:MAG: non-canonical purine NTP pyrophosphatase [Verrucomicrobiota bacterium]